MKRRDLLTGAAVAPIAGFTLAEALGNIRMAVRQGPPIDDGGGDNQV